MKINVHRVNIILTCHICQIPNIRPLSLHQYVDLFIHDLCFSIVNISLSAISHCIWVPRDNFLVNIFWVLNGSITLFKTNVNLLNWTTRTFIIWVFLLVAYVKWCHYMGYIKKGKYYMNASSVIINGYSTRLSSTLSLSSTLKLWLVMVL